MFRTDSKEVNLLRAHYTIVIPFNIVWGGEIC